MRKLRPKWLSVQSMPTGKQVPAELLGWNVEALVLTWVILGDVLTLWASVFSSFKWR